MVSHRKQRRRFDDGVAVYAKWPGSSYYYKAEIVNYDAKENHYSVKFSEGDDFIYQIAGKDIFHFTDKVKEYKGKGQARSRSRSRSRSSSRTRKSVRKKSRSPSAERRVRGRPRSDGERGRSPESHKNHDTSDDLAAKVFDIHRVPSEKQASITNEENFNIETINHIAEVATDNRNDEHLTHNLSIIPPDDIKGEETISNQDWLSNSSPKKQDGDKTQDAIRSIITSIFSFTFYVVHSCALFTSCSITLLLPVTFIHGFYLSCSENNNCLLLALPSMPKYLFETSSFAYVLGWYLFQVVITSLPFGRLTRGPSNTEKSKIVYRLNGFSSLFISMLLIGIVMYHSEIPASIIKDNYLNLINANYVFVLLVSFIIFLISRYGGSDVPTEGLLQDFVFGRVDNPMLFKGRYDIKTSAFKIGFISWAVMDIVYLVNCWTQSSESNVSLTLLVCFQLWYILDHMINEEASLYTSSSISSGKFGFTGLSGMLLFFPLFSSLQARFLSLHPQTAPWTRYVLPVALQVIGYFVYRLSVLEKFHFEKNPHKAKTAGAVYISSPSGRDILVNGWWGTVRHPNYLGDLLMNTSWALLCGYSHMLPWIWVITLLISLMGMARHEDSLSLKKCGRSWEEYQEEAKYRIIPLVY